MFKVVFKIPVSLSLFSLAFFGLGSSAISQEVEAWTNLGLYGGQIYDIAIDPSNPNKMFVGTYMGDGLFASTDGGNSWQAVETGGEVPGKDDFKNQANYAVKIAPSDPNVIWVAHNYWVEKSTDGGKTWTRILNSTMQRDCANCGGQGDDFRFCQAIAIDPMNPKIVYVATAGPKNTYLNGAIYKTKDGGQTWTKLNGGSDLDFAVENLDIDPQDSSIIWAVTSSHGFGGWRGTLYRSGNGGDTWTPILPFSQSYTFDSGIVTVAVHPGNSNTILTGGGKGIVRFFMDGSNVLGFDQPCYAQGCCLNRDITFDPNNPNIAYTVWLSPQSWGGDGTGKVGRSIDGGSTWTAYSLGSGPSDTLNLKTITVHPTNSEVIYAGEFNEGIFKSLDHGQTWTPVSNGISAVIVNDVVVDPNDYTHIIAGTFSGTYEKKGSGNWSQLIRDTTKSVQFHPTNSQTIYAGLEGWLAKTTDGGFNWNYTQVLGPDLGYGPDTYNYVSDIAIDYTDTDTIFISVNGFGRYGQIQKSTDGGASFVNVLDGINQSEENYPFNVVAIDPSDLQHIFAGGGSFYAPKIPGDMWESRDGGNTWQRTSLQNEIVNTIIINPVSSDIIYAGVGYSGGTKVPVYKSVDGGITWTASHDGIPVESAWNAVTDLEFHRQDSNVVYASTLSRGVYISPNQGKNWLNIETPKYNVLNISTSSLYTATQGGLLQCTGTGVIAGKVTDALSQADIHGATVFNDFGVNTISVNGEYMMVSPCGIWALTAIADGYANKTVWNVTVYGGDVNWTDIAMERGLSDQPPIFDGGNGGNGGGSDYECFIATAAYGSGMAEQVQILRAFRDDYLMSHAAGRKLVDLYYTTGKPIAIYIESHPWLKGPVRVILYPMVGLAWLLLSTTAFAKGVIVVCILIGCAGIIRFR